MKILLIAIASILATKASGQNWRLLDPKDVYIDAYKNETVHDPYIAPIDKELRYGSNFNMDLDVVKYKGIGLYWNNLLHFDQSSTSGHIKHAGWQYELGLTVLQEDNIDRVQIFRQHHSRHILEETRKAHFPVYDRFGVRFRIYP